jgi:hypothetical protein
LKFKCKSEVNMCFRQDLTFKVHVKLQCTPYLGHLELPRKNVVSAILPWIVGDFALTTFVVRCLGGRTGADAAMTEAAVPLTEAGVTEAGVNFKADEGVLLVAGVASTKAGVHLVAAGISLNGAGVGLIKAGVTWKDAGVSLSKVEVSLNGVGVGLIEAGVSLADTGVVLNKAGVVSDRAGVLWLLTNDTEDATEESGNGRRLSEDLLEREDAHESAS